MTLKIQQSATRVENQWWKWAVWVDGPPEEVERVDHVVYYLHPTFVPHIVTCGDRAKQFRLESQGWGEFRIRVRVFQKDGKQSTLMHELKLDGADDKIERGVINVFLSHSLSDSVVAESLRKDLESNGIIVVTARTSAGGSVVQPIEHAVQESDVVIALESRSRSSTFVEKEIELADQYAVPALRVLMESQSGETTRESTTPAGHVKEIRLPGRDSLSARTPDIASIVRKIARGE